MEYLQRWNESLRRTDECNIIKSWLEELGEVFWKSEITPYGPLSHLIVAPAVLLSFDNAHLSVFLYKIISLAVFLWSLSLYEHTPEQQHARGVRMLLLNPVILVSGIGDAHNDLFILSGLLVSLRFLSLDHLRGDIALALACLIKPTVLPLLSVRFFKDSKLCFYRILSSLSVVGFLLLAVMSLYTFNFSGMLQGLRMQAGLGCLYSCTPTVYLLQTLFPSHSKLVGLLSAGLIYAVSCYVYLYRCYRPYVFSFTVLLAVMFFAVEWLTPWYVIVILPFAIHLDTRNRKFPYLTLGLSAYSFYLYLRFT